MDSHVPLAISHAPLHERHHAWTLTDGCPTVSGFQAAFVEQTPHDDVGSGAHCRRPLTTLRVDRPDVASRIDTRYETGCGSLDSPVAIRLRKKETQSDPPADMVLPASFQPPRYHPPTDETVRRMRDAYPDRSPDFAPRPSFSPPPPRHYRHYHHHPCHHHHHPPLLPPTPCSPTDLQSCGVRTESSRSVSSVATSRQSLMTEPTSNTTSARIEKKRRYHRFIKLTHALLTVLQRRDKAAYAKTKAVIDDCEQRKQRKEPGYERLGESIKEPLKNIVSKPYWKEAKKSIGYKRQRQRQRPFQRISSFSRRYSTEAQMALDPLPLDHPASDTSTCITEETVRYVEHCIGGNSHDRQVSRIHADVTTDNSAHSDTPTAMDTSANNDAKHDASRGDGGSMQADNQAFAQDNALIPYRGDAMTARQRETRLEPTREEQKRQKDRFWMLVRVLMKYLEKKNRELHRRAKDAIQECMERNERNEPGYNSLTCCTRYRLRCLIDRVYWNRAECYLGHVLAKNDLKRSRTTSKRRRRISLALLASSSSSSACISRRSARGEHAKRPPRQPRHHQYSPRQSYPNPASADHREIDAPHSPTVTACDTVHEEDTAIDVNDPIPINVPVGTAVHSSTPAWPSCAAAVTVDGGHSSEYPHGREYVHTHPHNDEVLVDGPMM